MLFLGFFLVFPNGCSSAYISSSVYRCTFKKWFKHWHYITSKINIAVSNHKSYIQSERQQSIDLWQESPRRHNHQRTPQHQPTRPQTQTRHGRDKGSTQGKQNQTQVKQEEDRVLMAGSFLVVQGGSTFLVGNLPVKDCKKLALSVCEDMRLPERSMAYGWDGW